jgi:hypothetical protein
MLHKTELTYVKPTDLCTGETRTEKQYVSLHRRYCMHNYHTIVLIEYSDNQLESNQHTNGTHAVYR